MLLYCLYYTEQEAAVFVVPCLYFQYFIPEGDVRKGNEFNKNARTALLIASGKLPSRVEN